MQLLSDAAERLWYRLITAVDDFGRMEADPEVVFTTCFQRVPKGWTAQKTARCLEELTAHSAHGQPPLIHLYTIEQRTYLQVVSASMHIRCRAEHSKYPDPEIVSARNDGAANIRCQPLASAALIRTPNSANLVLRSSIPRTSVDEPTQAQATGSVDSFALTPELEAWSAKEGILNPGDYVDEFKDYWRSAGSKRKNGQAIKDWTAVFRNRLRHLKADGKLKRPDWKTQFLEEAKL